MKVNIGPGKTQYGPGVMIELTGEEVTLAIMAYLVSHSVFTSGPQTININNELCEQATIYVDPSGFVISDGMKYDGRTGKIS